MPNPQIHVAVGMVGGLILVSVIYPIIKRYYSDKARKFLLFLPLIILFGASLSMIPDIPELSKDFPSVAQPINLDYHDKPAWNIPIFNVFFLHPYLDSIFPEKYDTFGLILTLLIYNGIAGFYFYQSTKLRK